MLDRGGGARVIAVRRVPGLLDNVVSGNSTWLRAGGGGGGVLGERPAGKQRALPMISPSRRGRESVSLPQSNTGSGEKIVFRK